MTTKNETKHTPGPWMIERGSDTIGALGIWNASGIVACIEHNGRRGEADARLIAAAPELLEALCLLRIWALNAASGLHLPGPMPSELVALVDAAIAKAEGR